MNYIISQYLVFEKNDQGGILPETRWSRRTRLYNEGRAEALSNWKEYDNDTRALTQLNNALQNNGQTITDNAERQKIADKTLKNASERAKEYGNQIVANTKTLSDFNFDILCNTDNFLFYQTTLQSHLDYNKHLKVLIHV